MEVLKMACEMLGVVFVIGMVVYKASGLGKL
jgi:hypothetical protein